MSLRDWPIRQKLTAMFVLISGLVLLLTSAALVGYQYWSFRQTMRSTLTVRGRILATNSTASLAFANDADARELLAALRADPHIVAAALYDRSGRLFATYPPDLRDDALPLAPGPDGYRFQRGKLMGFQPVAEAGGQRLGTLYLASDLEAVYATLRLSGVIAVAVLAVALLAAYLLSRGLQGTISQPVLMLAETARAVSDRRDYSVRAAKLGEDELGALTDAFNHMLSRIEAQDRALRESKEGLEQRVTERTHELEERNQALRASEEQFRTLAVTANDAIISADSRGDITYFNPGAERIFGYTLDEVRGQPLTVLMPERFRDAHRAGMARYLKTGEARVVGKTVELVGRKQDGTEFPLELSLASRQHGSEVAFTGIIRDITRRKQVEDTLRRHTAQLEAANAELDAFAYSVSHDLRAPLRGIDGFSQALLEDNAAQLDTTGKDYLERVRAASQRMATLIDDLLNLSRVTRAQMHVGPVDLSRLAEAIAADLQKTDPDRAVEFAIAPGLQVQADPGLMRVVLQNLLDNAWKFTGKRPRARIEVGSAAHDGGPAYFVRDNGAGFDMTYVGKLFGAFQRLHGAQEFDGTGIGLATVQRVIHRHGGRVWAEGAVDRGATFYFTL